jgi:hypothetical protein
MFSSCFLVFFSKILHKDGICLDTKNQKQTKTLLTPPLSTVRTQSSTPTNPNSKPLLTSRRNSQPTSWTTPQIIIPSPPKLSQSPSIQTTSPSLPIDLDDETDLGFYEELDQMV